ncbi:MAG: GrpB family protein [Anaerolineae bacterium]|nr:GrpB family protein [Anaerolineae bacterium]
MPRPVVIHDYDPSWPAMFERERARIQEALAGRGAVVEHVGSTAVPGLGAKPIIDILIGVANLQEADGCVPCLVALGYTYFPEHEAEIPDRRYLDRQGEDGSYHVHMVEIGGDFWERHLLFRDYLRAHPEVAAEYDRLKRDLAQRYGTDREGYTNAKTDFVRAIEERARRDRPRGCSPAP